MSELDKFYDRLLKEGHLPSPRTYKVLVTGFSVVPQSAHQEADVVLVPVVDGSYRVLLARRSRSGPIIPAQIMHALFDTPLPPKKEQFEPVIDQRPVIGGFIYRYETTNEVSEYLSSMGHSPKSWSKWFNTWAECHKAAVDLQAVAVAHMKGESL